jgi:hypothetical protein
MVIPPIPDLPPLPTGLPDLPDDGGGASAGGGGADSIIYVYFIDKEQWTKYNNIKIRQSAILAGVNERSNVNLMVDVSTPPFKIIEFEGTAITDSTATLVTKEYPMFGAKIRRVSLEYEGTANNPVLTVIAHNRRFTTGTKEIDIPISQTGKFYGVPMGYKCDYIQFKVVGAEKIKMIRYTIA